MALAVPKCVQTTCDERDCGMWPLLFLSVCKPPVVRLWLVALSVPTCVQTTCGERDCVMWPLLFLGVCKPSVVRETVLCGLCCS